MSTANLLPERAFPRDWDLIKARHEAWWRGENDGPILNILESRAGARATDRWVESSSASGSAPEAQSDAAFLEGWWTDFDTVLARNLAAFQSAVYRADSFPRTFANLGVSTLAACLGATPRFTPDTVWYRHAFSSAAEADVHLDAQDPWLRWSLDMTRRLRAAEGGRFKTGIPDLCEHMDALSCLMNAQDLLVELIDSPSEVHRLLRQVQEAWRRAYELHYELLVEPDGFCCYGPFGLLGRGRLAKLQCDVSAMLSPRLFEEFVLPYLTEQCDMLNKSLYHLDGVDALRHLDAVLGIQSLGALQWTPGAGKPDGGDETWDFLYRKALDAGKRVYALVGPGNLDGFLRRFGGKGVFIVTQGL